MMISKEKIYFLENNYKKLEISFIDSNTSEEEFSLILTFNKDDLLDDYQNEPALLFKQSFMDVKWEIHYSKGIMFNQSKEAFTSYFEGVKDNISFYESKDYLKGEIISLLSFKKFMGDESKIQKIQQSNLKEYFNNNRPNKKDFTSPSVLVFDESKSLIHEIWYKEGFPHRDNLPSFISYYPKTKIIKKIAYYYKGHCHKDDGPAVVYYSTDGEITLEQFWLEGKNLNN